MGLLLPSRCAEALAPAAVLVADGEEPEAPLVEGAEVCALVVDLPVLLAG